MRRIVGSCLGAHWRLPVMLVPPRRQSVCFRQAWSVCVCVLFSQGPNITTLSLIPTLSDVRADLHNQSSMCGSRLWVSKGFVM